MGLRKLRVILNFSSRVYRQKKITKARPAKLTHKQVSLVQPGQILFAPQLTTLLSEKSFFLNFLAHTAAPSLGK